MHEIEREIQHILISGAGGDIGIGVGRILIDKGIKHVCGCDISLDNAGSCVFHFFTQVPKANDKNYLSSLKNLLTSQEIDLFIPTSEAEIEVILKHGLQQGKLFGVPVVMANEEAIMIALDKYKTAKFVKNLGLLAPWTISAEINLPKSLPCIYKPVRGQGSKGIEIVESSQRASELLGSVNYIWQQLLLPNDQEYTCGVFRSRKGEIRSILFKRTLNGGFTSKGEVITNREITQYIETIADKLQLVGAINIQLRLTDQGPILFEINPRFSSTVVFRDKLGFHDVIWAIEDLLGLTVSDYQAPQEGIKFYRGSSEYISQVP